MKKCHSNKALKQAIECAQSLSNMKKSRIGTLPAAHLVDRWSRSKTIGVMAFVWSAFTLVTGTAAGLNALIISRFASA